MPPPETLRTQTVTESTPYIQFGSTKLLDQVRSNTLGTLKAPKNSLSDSARKEMRSRIYSVARN